MVMVCLAEVPLVGGAKIRAFTANLQDPPLPDRAERPVLRGDANAEIPLMVATLRSVLGQVDLDTLLSDREKLNLQLQTILDKHTDPWGIKVSAVEVKHVDLPENMQRAMARQAEAEREKRAKIIHAAGELEASEKLSQAAEAADMVVV